MGYRFLDPNPQFCDSNGDPVASGTVTFYTPGTLTLKNVYTSSALSVATDNPMSLNSAGRAASEIFLSGEYRAILKDSSGATVWDRDPVSQLLTATQAQAAAYINATVGGTADVITLTPTPAFTAYADGQSLEFTATGTNTTNVTVNVSGLGAKALTKAGTTALVAGDIVSGQCVRIRYDGTRFQLMTPNSVYLFRNGGNEPARVDVADGATVNLTPATINSRYARLITSTTAITAITLPDGNACKVLFNTARTLTNGASLILPGGVDITTAAGDTAEFVGESGAVVRCLRYTRAAGGSDGLLSTTTASGAASADIPLPTGFRHYEVYFDATVATDGAELNFRVSTDGGATFKSGATDYQYATHAVDATPTATMPASNGDSHIRIATNVGSAAAEGVDGRLTIRNPAGTTRSKIVTFQSGHRDNTAVSLHVSTVGSGNYTATTAVNAIQFLASAGNISGTFKLYGYA